MYKSWLKKAFFLTFLLGSFAIGMDGNFGPLAIRSSPHDIAYQDDIYEEQNSSFCQGLEECLEGSLLTSPLCKGAVLGCSTGALGLGLASIATIGVWTSSNLLIIGAFGATICLPLCGVASLVIFNAHLKTGENTSTIRRFDQHEAL